MGIRKRKSEHTLDSFLQQAQPIWRGQEGEIWNFYCPHCFIPRKLPYRPQPGSTRQLLQVGLTAAFLTCLLWPWFGWKGIISFIPLWGGFETIYRIRVRSALGCPSCGFDPYLYLSDVGRARKEIENHWRKKFAEKGIPFPKKPVEALKMTSDEF